MSFNLPDRFVLPTSPERHNLSIAEIVIFSVVLPMQLCIRYMQIRYHFQARGGKHPVFCFLRAWLNFIVIFALVRIIGFALSLAVTNPGNRILITEVTLQSVGLSALLLELSLTLLRCGRTGPENKISYPKLLSRALQYTRLPVLTAVILIIVAGSLLNLSFLKAGAVLLLATFVYLTGITVSIATLSHLRRKIGTTGRLGLLVLIAALPFYTVRVIYLLLIEFGSPEFDPVVGDWRYLVGMGFTMEVAIVLLVVAAGAVVEPSGVWSNG